MSAFNGPGAVSEGLVFAYDIGNSQKSWRGAPTTNLASFNVAASGFNTDTPGNLSQTSNSSEQTFKGRLSRRMVILAAGYWNCYIYSYNTGVSSTVFAASCKIKTADGSHPNTFIAGGYIYGSAGSFFPTLTFSLEDDGWYRVTWLYSGSSMTLNSLTGLNGTSPSAKTFFITDYQVEALSFSTPFAGVSGGSRSNTQALLDLTNNNTINTNSLTYSSNNTFSFNSANSNNIAGTMNSAYHPSTNSIDRSWEVFVKPTATQTTAGLFGHVVSAGCTYYCNGGVCIWGGNYAFNWFDNSAYQFLDSGIAATSGQWAHVVGTYSSSDGKTRIYVNGILRNTFGSSTNLNYGAYAYEYQTGYLSASGNYFTGDMSVVKYYYNKSLSAAQVQQNFQALRTRYSI